MTGGPSLFSGCSSAGLPIQRVAADLFAEKPESAWLYTVANRQLSRCRRGGRVELRAVERLGLSVPRLDEESSRAIQALLDGDAQRADLADAISCTAPAEREALELRVLEELDYREITIRLNCTVVAARVRVHRRLTRLNKSMEMSS
jgi:RNA polymerase sigma-70 factor (ECF subfamily)